MERNDVPRNPGSDPVPGRAEDPNSPAAQMRRLRDAAVLAAGGRFRCAACEQVYDLKDGIAILARKNILFGLDMECAKKGAILIRPQADGSVHINIAPNTPRGVGLGSRIQPASLSDVRAVEMSKVSAQRAETVDYATGERNQITDK